MIIIIEKCPTSCLYIFEFSARLCVYACVCEHINNCINIGDEDIHY